MKLVIEWEGVLGVRDGLLPPGMLDLWNGGFVAYIYDSGRRSLGRAICEHSLQTPKASDSTPEDHVVGRSSVKLHGLLRILRVPNSLSEYRDSAFGLKSLETFLYCLSFLSRYGRILAAMTRLSKRQTQTQKALCVVQSIKVISNEKAQSSPLPTLNKLVKSNIDKTGASVSSGQIQVRRDRPPFSIRSLFRSIR